MGLAHSPSIVTNGLVFAYDMGNTQKSWKGALTTNLLQSTNFTTGWAGYCGSTSNVTYNTLDTTAPDGSYTTLKHVRGSETGCGEGGSWGLLHSLASVMTVGQPYTISVWAKTNGPSFSVTLGHNDAAGTGISLNSQWQRFSYTYTPGNTSRGFQFINGNLNTTTYWWNPQCEISTFATPFVNGTRSNTQAILDQTNNNTITASSLTYASDGTFSFNGTSNYINLNTNIQSGYTSASYEFWCRPTTLPGSGIYFQLYIQESSTWIALYNTGSGAFFGIDLNNGAGWFDNNGGNNTGAKTTSVLTGNNIYHVTYSWNGSTVSVYLNGNLQATVSTLQAANGRQNVTQLGAGTASRNIGSRYDGSSANWVGSIYSTKFYNRALSAAEVQQNFNALKMRYYGENSEVPATSGYDLKSVRPNLPSGYYWIKNNSMPNALRMYVDMSEEGGGYDFYPIQGTGTSIGSTNGIHSGIALGLDLVYPRSKQHWIAMSNFVRNVLGSTGNEYFTTVYSVHRETSGGAGSRGGNYTGDIMRNPAFYASGAPDWKVPDGGRWWLRDTTFGEPNGDYTAYNFLGGYTFPNPYTGQDLSFNDVTGQTLTTGTYYLVSTNAKP